MAKEKSNRFVVVEVPTETQKVIKDNENNNADGSPVLYDSFALLAKIANDIEEIKRSL